MDVKISEAGIDDVDMLVKWRIKVLREVFCIPDDCSVEELERANKEYYEVQLPAGGHVACFAREKEEVVGCGGICVYREMPSPDNPSGWCAYLMNIYVCPNVRGRGIGGRVVDWLVKQAKQRDITKIYLETSGSGRKLYEKMGFSDMANMMALY